MGLSVTNTSSPVTTFQSLKPYEAVFISNGEAVAVKLDSMRLALFALRPEPRLYAIHNFVDIPCNNDLHPRVPKGTTITFTIE